MKFSAFLCLMLSLSVILIPAVSLVGDGESSATAEVSAVSVNVDEKFPDKVKVYFTQTGKTKTVDMNSYVIGSVCAEISPEYSPEAIKAQAVACRTYVLYMIENDVYDKGDISDDWSIHQGYLSVEELKNRWGEKFDIYYKTVADAVKAVENKVMTYDGKIIQPAFFALCSGKTENAEDVWGSKVPYLLSVATPGDELAGELVTKKEFSKDDFLKCMSSLKDFDGKSEISFSDAVKTDGGYVKSININGKSYSGNMLQDAFSLKSNNFTLKKDGDTFVFSVTGNGHGVGMSQYGADYMARQGSSFEEILKHYYTGVEIE